MHGTMPKAKRIIFTALSHQKLVSKAHVLTRHNTGLSISSTFICRSNNQWSCELPPHALHDHTGYKAELVRLQTNTIYNATQLFTHVPHSTPTFIMKMSKLHH